MGKEKELKSATALVKDIMLKDKKSRNSDAYLYCKVIERLNKGSSKLPFYVVMKHTKDMGLPCYDTVTRIRRKVQETNPELQSDEFIAKCRAENEKDFEDYARS